MLVSQGVDGGGDLAGLTRLENARSYSVVF